MTSASPVVTFHPRVIGFRQSFVGSRRLTRVLSYHCSFQYHQRWDGCVWIGIPWDPTRMVQDGVAEKMSVFSQLCNPHMSLKRTRGRRLQHDDALKCLRLFLKSRAQGTSRTICEQSPVPLYHQGCLPSWLCGAVSKEPPPQWFMTPPMCTTVMPQMNRFTYVNRFTYLYPNIVSASVWQNE